MQRSQHTARHTARRTAPHRILAVLVAATLLLAACSRDGDPDDTGLDVNDPETTLPTDDNGGGDGSGGTNTTTAPNGGGPQTTAKNGRTQTTARHDGGGTQTTPTTRADQAYASAKGGAGAYARTVLRPQPATKVVLEIMHQAGMAPAQNNVNHAVNVLKEVTGKSVSLSGPYEIPGGANSVTEGEVESMSDRHAKTQHGNGTAVIRILYLKGAFENDDSVLGVAVRGDTAAIMSDQVRASASPFASRTQIEDAVTIHEIGHLLGLVDIVLKTGRADPDHAGHSSNRESVMYWAVESDVVSQVLGGPPPVNFDSADRADLAAIRNGA